MQKILLTGANGFIGYYTTKFLLEKNFIVIASGKGPSRLPFQSEQLHYETLDFTIESEVKKVFAKHQPQVIIHCGAISKPDDCELNRDSAFLINVTGTVHLLKYASMYKSFFLFLSTDFVFDGKKGMYIEEDETGPVNYYGRTKELAEKEVMQYAYAWSIVRTVLVYGKPFLNRQNILTNTANSLRIKEPLKIFNDQVRTPTYVEDLAKALVRIIESNATGIFHISGKDVMTPYQMAIATAEFLNLDRSLISCVTESDFDQPARRPLITGFDISKAAEVLEYQPLSFREGLERTFSEM